MLNPALNALFTEYADAHRHPTNRLTHKIAIPLIVFHIVAMLDWVKLVQIPGSTFTVSLGHVAFAVAVGWYLRMNVKLGLILAVGYGLCFPLGWVTPRWAVVVLAVFAWLVQLAGHLVWEKKQPAFFRNLLQALVGPMFFVAVLTGDWPAAQPATAPARS